MGARTKYEDLTIIPAMVATTVANEVYTAEEISEHIRSASVTEHIEKLRQAMTTQQHHAFVDECDRRCRAAYGAGAEWFLKIARSKTNHGRDQLYMWTRHWLAAFLLVQNLKEK